MDIQPLVIPVDARQVTQADQAMGKMSNSANLLEGMVTKLAAAWASWELGKHIADLALIAARYETLGIAMNQVGLNAGYTSTQMAQFQIGLQNTGISAIEARNNLARMAAAQLDLTKSSQLARVAQDAAVLADINSSQAFEMLVQGIVSGQPRILHTMGIFADFMGAEKAWADAHGRTMESLSQTEKVQIRLNNTLEEGAKRAGVYEAAMGTAGKQIRSMERFIQDLEVQVGKTMGEALIASVARVVTGFKDASKAMDEWEKSGNQGVLAMKLRDDLMALMDVLIGSVEWIIKHRDAIGVLAAAYASFKIAGIVIQLGQFVVTQYNSVAAHIAAAAAAYNEANAVTRDAVAKAGFTYVTTLSNEAQIAEAQTMLMKNGLAIQSALATGALTEQEAMQLRTEQQLVAVELERAAAINATNAAQRATSVAIGGITGGLTLLITLLGTAVAAWMLFKDTQDSESKDAAKFMDERIQRATETVDKTRRFWKAIAQGKSAGEAESASWSAMDDPAARKGLENIQKLQAAFDKANETYQVGLSGNLPEGMMAGAIDDRAKAQNRLNDALDRQQRLIAAITSEHNNLEAKEKYLAGLNKPVTPKITDDMGTALTGYGTELERLQEELTKLTVSERDAVEMKLQLLANKDEKTIGQVYDVSEALAVFDLIKAQKDLNAELSKDRDTAQAHYDTLMSYRDAYDKIALSEREYLRLKMDGEGYTKDEIDQTLALVDATKQLTDAKAKRESLEKEAAKLNLRNNTTTGMAHLDDLKANGLNPEVYREQLHKLLLESQTIWGAIAYSVENFADRGSSALANFFNGTKTGFREMVSSMLVDLEKLILKQQVVQPLLNSAGGFFAELLNGSRYINSEGGSYVPAPSGVRAAGGPVSYGSSYLVGEKGPELFTPRTSGNITPNHALGGQTNNVSISVNVANDGTAKISTQGASTLASDFEDAVVWVLAKHQRPGGVLNPVYS